MTQQEFQTRYTYNPTTDKLGEGGFGSVFKAYDNHLDRWVAIKIAKVNLQYETIRLRKEAEMVAKLPTHPNIARYEECYTFFSFDGEYDFGILQYYEEGSLMQLLKNNALQLSQKLSLLSQIIDGINFLHQNGIIHRDLKPQNILIVKRGNEYIPKITDFGISKKLDLNRSSVFSNSIAGAGTLSYASPEQLGDKEIRKNTDLWSLGVITFQMFTGKLPFNTGEHASTSEAGRMELFRQINSGKLPREIGDIPEPWQTLIFRSLITDPEKRIKNTAEAKVILSEKQKKESAEIPLQFKEKVNTPIIDDTIIEKQTQKPTPATPPFPPPIKDHPSPSSKGIWMGIGIAAVIVMVVVVYFLSNREPAPPLPTYSGSNPNTTATPATKEPKEPKEQDKPVTPSTPAVKPEPKPAEPKDNTQEAANLVQQGNNTFKNSSLGTARYEQSFQLYKKAKGLGGNVSAGYQNFLSVAKTLIENGAGFDANVKKMLQYAQQLNDTQEVRDLLKKCH